MPGVIKCRLQDIGYRAIEVGVGQYHVRRFATEFQRHRGHVLRCGHHHVFTGLYRTGKGNVAHLGMFGERATRDIAVTGDDVHDPGWNASLFEDLDHQQRRHRRVFSRLDDRGIAAGECRAKPARDHVDRYVPRNDVAGDANRHAFGKTDLVLAERHRAALELVDDAGVIAKVIRGAFDPAACIP